MIHEGKKEMSNEKDVDEQNFEFIDNGYWDLKNWEYIARLKHFG